MGTIRVGIIGLGYWGITLFNSLSKNKKIKIVKICGRENKNYGDIFTKNHMEVLTSDIDLVIIATQPKYHYELTMLALKNGKHVLVEKPLALSSKEISELIEYSNKVNKLLFVNHIYSTNPAVLKMVEALKDIHNGDMVNHITYESYRFNESCTDYETTILEDLMYHDFYLMKLLIGSVDLNESEIDLKPHQYCKLTKGGIKLVSSYQDVKKRLIKINSNSCTVIWDEVYDNLNINGFDIEIDRNQDNINYKIDAIIEYMENGVDDGSKYESLEILKLIESFNNKLVENDL